MKAVTNHRTIRFLLVVSLGMAVPTSVAPPSTAAPRASKASAPAAAPTVRHPAGFHFVQPAGWRVQKQEDGNLRLMPGDAGELELVLVTVDSAQGITRVDDPRLLELAENDLRQLFPFLARVGDGVAVRTALGPGRRFAWEGTNPADVEVRAALWAVLMGQKAVALFAVGPKEQIAAREAALQRLFAGFAPDRPAPPARARASGSAKARAGKKPARTARAAPAGKGGGKVDNSALAKAWRQRLTGKKLTRLSSYSSGSSGGYNSRSDMLLNRDGTFVYQSSSSVSIYVPGATGSSGGREASEGKWRIFARGKQAILEVVPQGEKPQQFQLAFQDRKTYLNGTRVFVTDP